MVGRLAGVDGSSYVCDLACGACFSSIELVNETGCCVLAIDSSVESICIAAERIKRCNLEDRLKLIHDDVKNVEPDWSCSRLGAMYSGFDLVIAEGGILNYLGLNEFHDLAFKLCRIGGYVFVSFLTENRPYSNSLSMISEVEQTPSHVIKYYSAIPLQGGVRIVPTEENVFAKFIENDLFEIVTSFRSDGLAWARFFDKMLELGHSKEWHAKKDKLFTSKSAYASCFYDQFGYKYINYTNLLLKKVG